MEREKIPIQFCCHLRYYLDFPRYCVASIDCLRLALVRAYSNQPTKLECDRWRLFGVVNRAFKLDFSVNPTCESVVCDQFTVNKDSSSIIGITQRISLQFIKVHIDLAPSIQIGNENWTKTAEQHPDWTSMFVISLFICESRLDQWFEHCIYENPEFWLISLLRMRKFIFSIQRSIE